MSSTTITVAGNPVTLVALPSSPGLRSVQFTVSNAVATVTSPFTGQVQAQQWPGADMLRGTAVLPPLTQAQADSWIAFLMELRGMANAFQLGDPLKTQPRGVPLGTPLVDNTQNSGNLAMSQYLGVTGWTANAAGLLLPGDYIQVGYRLHRVLAQVNSDASGNSLIQIAPSLREQPTNSTPIILSNTKGIFRLAKNDITWSADVTLLTRLSFPVQEYR